MESSKYQSPPDIVVRPLPLDGNKIFDFRHSPIIIVPAHFIRKPYYYGSLSNKHGSRHQDDFCSLIWCNEETNVHRCDRCSFCNCVLDKTIGYYYVCKKFNISNDFNVYLHKECIKPIKNNLYHPQHPLQALTYYKEEGRQCYCCYSKKKYFHYCSLCDFRVCHECVQEQPLLTITYPKRHKHTLNYIHRKASITCDVCGLDDRRYFIYMCYHCDFVVHKECIYFPHIIKIFRHNHRLNFASTFEGLDMICEICCNISDGKYGGYYCAVCHNYCGSFFAHSKCAIQTSIWDGKELEGQLEDINDNISCPKCHRNPKTMRFHKEIDKAKEKEKKCQACAFPIHDGDIFSCIKCDLVLHIVCARLPPKKIHMMHRPDYPLNLTTNRRQNLFKCSACERVCSSFRYYCSHSYSCDFHIDVNCASIPAVLNYHSHNHLLFLSSETGSSGICSICQNSREYYLECEDCDFVLCFGCATLPKTFMYKNDEHPLVFTFGEDVNGIYWCDMCEDKINQKYGTYMCNGCNVALHIGCLFGEDFYVLPGKDLIQDFNGVDVNYDILVNDRLTRYLCKYCHKRSQSKLIFKTLEGDIFCSVSCIVISMSGKDFPDKNDVENMSEISILT